MKILLLTSALDIGGAETHILTLVTALVRRGHTVTVMSEGGCYAKTLTGMGVPHRFLPLKKSTPVTLLRSARILSRALRRDPPDVIHAHTRNTAFLANLVAGRLGIPVVTTAHLCFSTSFPRRQLAYWGERTLAVSADIRAHLLAEYGLYRDNVSLTVNGIDESVFYPSSASVSPYSVASVSRLDRDRSHTATLLIGIAERLYRRFPDFRLTVVGAGTEFERLSHAAEAVNRSCGVTVVRLLGAQSEVAPILRKNAVFVGCSRAALEALASGCRTVLSGDEGYLSLFSPENAHEAVRTNFCFRGTHPASENDLYMDISALFDEKEPEKHKRIQYGIEFVRKHYSTERMASDAENVYAAVLRPKTGRSAVILGYYGYGNLGDEATLRGMIGLLRRAGFGRITVLSRDPRATARREGVKAVFRYAPLRILWAIARSDLFLFGGGTLLQDKTSKRSLLYYDFISRLAKAAGKKFVFLGGVGALSATGEIRARRILARADAVYCRTPADVRAAASLGAAAELYPDVAFTVNASYAKMPQGDTFVICLQDGWAAERYASLICDVIAVHGIHPVFAVLSGEDAHRAERLARMTGGEATPLLTPSALRDLLSRARGAIGTRLHFLIFALTTGLPVFALSHDEKGRYLTEYVNGIEKERMTFGHPCDEQLGFRLSEFVTAARKRDRSTSVAEKIKESAESVPRALL